MYAALLKETADLYTYRDRDDLALGARQLGLYVALSVALDQPADLQAVHALVDELKNALGEAGLHAPTRELLERFEQASSA